MLGDKVPFVLKFCFLQAASLRDVAPGRVLVLDEQVVSAGSSGPESSESVSKGLGCRDVDESKGG